MNRGIERDAAPSPARKVSEFAKVERPRYRSLRWRRQHDSITTIDHFVEKMLVYGPPVPWGELSVPDLWVDYETMRSQRIG